MEMLDRYLNEVEKYLRKKDSAVILDKIRSDVMEMIDSKNNIGINEEDAVKEYLIELGSPLEIARKFDSNIGYVVGPKLFKIYWLVIGYSIMGTSIAFAMLTIIQLSFNLEMNIGSAMLRLFGQIFSVALSVIGSVTIVFYIIQKYISKDALSDEEWHPEDLPELPKKEESINRTGVMIGTVMLIVFMYIFNFHPEIIGVFYSKNGGPMVFKSLLSTDNISPYLIVLDPLWFLAIASNVYMLIKGKKSLKPQIINDFALIGVFATLWVMLGNQEIIESAGEWGLPFSASLRMGFAAVVIVFVVDIIRKVVLLNK